MKAKSVNTGTSDVTLMSVVPVTSVVTVRSAGTMKNAVTVTSCSCDCAKCCEFGEYQITKTTESSFRFFTFFPRRLMLMCLTCKYIRKSFFCYLWYPDEYIVYQRLLSLSFALL